MGEFITDLDKAIARPAGGISGSAGKVGRPARNSPEWIGEGAVKCLLLSYSGLIVGIVLTYTCILYKKGCGRKYAAITTNRCKRQTRRKPMSCGKPTRRPRKRATMRPQSLPFPPRQPPFRNLQSRRPSRLPLKNQLPTSPPNPVKSTGACSPA